MQHGLGGAHGSEDCLFLNVFMPSAASIATARPAPVLVEIHGGGFQGGRASQLWNLTRATGAVTVSIQYRLNVFGFFSTGVVPPILGLRDQRLALQWVRDNAPAFGGDRNHVMIYGSSAGGASVAGHLVLPESAGLFHAAAIESPGGHQGWMPGTQRTDDDWMSTKMVVMFSTQLAIVLAAERRAT